MKSKKKTKDYHLIVRVRPSSGEKIDYGGFDFFSHKYPRGFMKPKIINKKLIEYTGPIGISLYERLNKPITKYEFFFIIEQIIIAAKKLQEAKIPLNRLILNIYNVYINEITKEVQFIYFPIKTEDISENIIEFIESIVYSTIPTPEKDTEHISQFAYFIKNLQKFDADAIEKYIFRIDKNVVDTIQRFNGGQSGFMTDKPKDYYGHYDKKPDFYEDATGLLDEETGLLADEDEGTILLDEDQKESMNDFLPTLFRVLTEETIRLTKPRFRIGKERSRVDYFVTANNAVSRNHAEIITRGNKYFVIDLNSKNHTYMNGQLLPVQCEVEIHDGDRLQLANEEFIFHVRL